MIGIVSRIILTCGVFLTFLGCFGVTLTNNAQYIQEENLPTVQAPCAELERRVVDTNDRIEYALIGEIDQLKYYLLVLVRELDRRC